MQQRIRNKKRRQTAFAGERGSRDRRGRRESTEGKEQAGTHGPRRERGKRRGKRLKRVLKKKGSTLTQSMHYNRDSRRRRTKTRGGKVSIENRRQANTERKSSSIRGGSGSQTTLNP